MRTAVFKVYVIHIQLANFVCVGRVGKSTLSGDPVAYPCAGSLGVFGLRCSPDRPELRSLSGGCRACEETYGGDQTQSCHALRCTRLLGYQQTQSRTLSPSELVVLQRAEQQALSVANGKSKSCMPPGDCMVDCRTLFPGALAGRAPRANSRAPRTV